MKLLRNKKSSRHASAPMDPDGPGSHSETAHSPGANRAAKYVCWEGETATPVKTLPGEEALLRPHQFDGIQELDNPMPNWWLGILFASIAFALGYWAVFHAFGPPVSPGEQLRESMARSAEEAAKQSGQLSSPLLWKMSRDPSVVALGKTVYLGSCAPCHLPDLAGAIGPNLKDQIWIHGGDPMTILRVITEGVAIKGMPTWGPVLGRQKIAEVTAFILSHHEESASPTPPAAPTAPPVSPSFPSQSAPGSNAPSP